MHLVEHDDLGNEGNGLEPQGETPGEGPWGPASIKNASKHEGNWDQHLEVRELIAKRVIGRAVWHLILHQVNDEGCSRDKEYLHERVID